MSIRTQYVALVAILLVGTVLRFSGLDWGARSLDGFILDGEELPITRAGFSADAEMLYVAAESLSRGYFPVVTYASVEYHFTSYGTLFLYLYRIFAEIGSWFGDYDAFGVVADDVNPSRIAGRVVSALSGVLLIWVTWLVGRRVLGDPGALGAALLAAVLPMSVQAAHLATVDGLLGLWYGAVIWGSLRVLDTGELGDYLVTGVLIGLAVATKINGLFLLLPLGLAHLLRESRLLSLDGIRSAVLSKSVYAGVGVSLLTWLILTPAAVFESSDYFTPDFAGPYHVLFSLRKASESVSAHRGWLHLEGASTYFYHLTDVFPLGLGWVVQVACLAGLVIAFAKRAPAVLLIAISFLVYYLLVARLPDKPIRFFVPMATAFACLVVYPAAFLTRRHKPAALVLALGVLAAEPALRSTALATVYHAPDSRIEAARWIQVNLEVGDALMIERGHNGLAPLVSRRQVRLLAVDLEHELANARDRTLADGHYTAVLESDFLSQVDYFVLSEERMALRRVRPSAVDFYTRLFNGELGFRLRATFSMRPELFGIAWEDESTDLNWSRYDHPTTYVFERETHEPSLYASRPELAIYRLQSATDTQDLLLRSQKYKSFTFFKRCLSARYKEGMGERKLFALFKSFLRDPTSLTGSGQMTVIQEGASWRIKLD